MVSTLRCIKASWRNTIVPSLSFTANKNDKLLCSWVMVDKKRLSLMNSIILSLIFSWTISYFSFIATPILSQSFWCFVLCLPSSLSNPGKTLSSFSYLSFIAFSSSSNSAFPFVILLSMAKSSLVSLWIWKSYSMESSASFLSLSSQSKHRIIWFFAGDLTLWSIYTNSLAGTEPEHT